MAEKDTTVKILMIAATHGNELLGIKLYQRLLQKRSPLLEHINFMLGHSRAFAAKKRYIECDLNRSYGVNGQLYEQQRAAEIAAYISETKPDIVLDMHTTSCIQPNCLIVGNLDGAAKQRLLAASHITTILAVQPMNDVATLGNNVVGYEIPNRSITPALLDTVAEDLQRFVDNQLAYPHKKLYRMQNKIYKSDVSTAQAGTFVNFEMHELGYVPIMTGENSYKKQTNYLGFKASAPEDITL